MRRRADDRFWHNPAAPATGQPVRLLEYFDLSLVFCVSHIRYPDTVLKRGAKIIIEYQSALTPKPQLSTPPRPEPEYKLDFYEMDRLVGAIFRVSSLNPLFFTLGLKPDVRAMLARDNPVAAQLLPPSS